MFSVIIPLYNKELSIKGTLESVLIQSFRDFEIVIVNDGSTDTSLSVVEEIDDSRIRVINQKNQGVSAARNKGITEAKNDWITFLDADDLWASEHLSTFAEMIKQFPEDRVFCTSHTKSKQSLIEEESDKIFIIEDYFQEVLRNVDFFWTSACCIHKLVFAEVGGFVIEINRGEDLDLWARIGKEYQVVRSYRRTAVYRTDSENKLTAKRSVYEKSVVSIISLKGLRNNERKYYKKLLFTRMKQDIKGLDFKSVLKLILKHHVELIK